ncbi:acyltransferase family protein [Streptomyces sp. CA-251251]|uniref:acyltransferase family protein n=1 Tax=Streptomyces sp. CA-251251 TaxID=3240063 RepID=UPI003D9364D8
MGAHGKGTARRAPTADARPGTALQQTAVQPTATAVQPTATAVQKAATGGRDRYFDVLRALALVRVVAYHAFGWPWAGLVFPSMGVMFCLAGTLMARSLRRPAATVVRARLRRLLPPLWCWGVFVVGAMLVRGWMPGWQIVFWVVPLGDPPGSAWAEQAWEVLWYLRTYLWLVLLSPLLLRVFRLAPVPVLLLSLAPVVALQCVWRPPENRLGTGLLDLATYLFCWVLGFAHREGVLGRLRPAAVVALSCAALACGGWYAFAHRAAYGTYDLDDIPLAQAFWSAGFVTPLMYARARLGAGRAGLTRWRWWWRWPARWRWPVRLVGVLNARAVTVYLWHEVALVAAVPLIDRLWDVPAFEAYLPLDSQWFLLGVAWALIAVLVLLFGWVEDVAARRRPRLLP